MTTTENPLPTASPSVPGQRSALLLTLALALVGTALALLTGNGERQVVGALVGAATVGAFFLFGSLTTGFVATHAPQASLMVALMTYTLQVLVLAMLLATVAQSQQLQDALDERWLGGAVLAGALAWTGALVAGALARPVAGPATGPTRGDAR